MRWPREAWILVAALAACAEETPPESDPPVQGVETLADRACPDESFLDYGNFGGPFFSEYCTGCHSSQIPADMRRDAPIGADFETLEGIRERADLIYLRAADGYALMPPIGGPADEARVLLGDWLACGAPD